MAIYMWRERVMPDYPCFTALASSASVRFVKNWTPTSVTLETSTDWLNWSTYTFWTAISLPNVWDKVYFRNTSETDTGFSIDWDNRYWVQQLGADIGNIAVSWDFSFLLNKNWTTNVSNYCFNLLFYNNYNIWEVSITLPATTLASYCYAQMFYDCGWLTTANITLPATTLASNCYYAMFRYCSNLTNLINLPATTLATNCYSSMFRNCSKIKLSTTQTWEYQTPYKIPTTWTWTDATNALQYMFSSTWWTFTWTPSINTTYYTSNTVV